MKEYYVLHRIHIANEVAETHGYEAFAIKVHMRNEHFEFTHVKAESISVVSVLLWEFDLQLARNRLSLR